MLTSSSKIVPGSTGSPGKLKSQKSLRASSSTSEVGSGSPGKLKTFKSMRAATGNDADMMSPATASNLARANSGKVSTDAVPTKLSRGKSAVGSADSSPAVSRTNSGITKGHSSANLNRAGSFKDVNAAVTAAAPHTTPIGEFKPKLDEFYTANACCCALIGFQFVDMKHAYIQLELCCMRQDICCVGIGNDVCIIGSGADIDSCCAVGLRCCSFSLVTPKGICIIEHHCCCCHAMANFCHPEGFNRMPVAFSILGFMIAPLLGCCVKLSDAIEYDGSCCHCP
jgi:hypothetical protein